MIGVELTQYQNTLIPKELNIKIPEYINTRISKYLNTKRAFNTPHEAFAHTGKVVFVIIRQCKNHALVRTLTPSCFPPSSFFLMAGFLCSGHAGRSVASSTAAPCLARLLARQPSR